MQIKSRFVGKAIGLSLEIVLNLHDIQCIGYGKNWHLR